MVQIPVLNISQLSQHTFDCGQDYRLARPSASAQFLIYCSSTTGWGAIHRLRPAPTLSLVGQSAKRGSNKSDNVEFNFKQCVPACIKCYDETVVIGWSRKDLPTVERTSMDRFQTLCTMWKRLMCQATVDLTCVEKAEKCKTHMRCHQQFWYSKHYKMLNQWQLKLLLPFFVWNFLISTDLPMNTYCTVCMKETNPTGCKPAAKLGIQLACIYHAMF